MTDTLHAYPGRLVAPLALDAAVPLYGLLHVPPDDGSLRLHAFLKQAVEYGQFAFYHKNLWTAVEGYAAATLPAQEAHDWLGWISNGFTGIHPAHPDLSGWLMTLEHIRYNPKVWAGTTMSTHEIKAVETLIERYFSELDEDAFMAAVAECQARPMTDWDKRLHMAYEFVYFDRASGSDPFLALKFLNQGESLRRAVRATDLTEPAFPAEKLRARAQALMTERDIRKPDGWVIGDLSAVL